MTTYRYPQEVHDMVKEWAPKLRDRELAALVNGKLFKCPYCGAVQFKSRMCKHCKREVTE